MNIPNGVEIDNILWIPSITYLSIYSSQKLRHEIICWMVLVISHKLKITMKFIVCPIFSVISPINFYILMDFITIFIPFFKLNNGSVCHKIVCKPKINDNSMISCIWTCKNMIFISSKWFFHPFHQFTFPLMFLIRNQLLWIDFQISSVYSPLLWKFAITFHLCDSVLWTFIQAVWFMKFIGNFW